MLKMLREVRTVKKIAADQKFHYVLFTNDANNDLMSKNEMFRIRNRINFSCWIRIQVYKLHLNLDEFFSYL